MRERAALAALVALLLTLVALSGCSALSADDPSLPSGEDAARGFESLEAVGATVEYRHLSPDTTSNTTVRTVQRIDSPATRQRVRSPSGLAGDVTVRNESVLWLYDENENEVTRLSVGGLSLSNTSNAAFVERVFGNLTGTDERAVVANPQLPVGPLGSGAGGGQPAVTRADLVGPTRLTVSYVGTETVAGRTAYGVAVDPVNGSDDGDGLASHIENATYWFDAEYFYPLRVETVISVRGNLTRGVQVTQNVTFDPEIEPGTFQFDPPPDATVETAPTPRTATFDSAAAAGANVSFDVAAPDPLEGFDLESARVSRLENRTTVLLEYAADGREFTVSTRRPPASEPEGETVSLGPTNATLATLGNTTALRWRCGGLGYTVRGDLSDGAIREVARDAAERCQGAPAS